MHQWFMKLSSSFLQSEGMWEISFVPLEWCSENKNEYIHQAVLQLFHTAPFWLCFKYGNPMDVICSCDCNLCTKWEGCFLHLPACFPLFKDKLWWTIECSSNWNRGLRILASLLAWLHQCQWVCCLYLFSKSLKATQNALHGQVMLCWASLWSKGRFMGSPFPSWALQLPPAPLRLSTELFHVDEWKTIEFWYQL